MNQASDVNSASSSPEHAEWKQDAKKKLSVLTHDLRNPIATFQSFLNILEMEDYHVKPEELKELSQNMQTALEQALKKVDATVMQIKKDWDLA